MDGDRLESWWERPGHAVDRSGREEEQMLLAKRVLLPGLEFYDPARLEALLGAGLEDVA